MQQADGGEHALHFLVADKIVLQCRAGELAVGKKAVPRRRAERGERRGRERRRGRRGDDQRCPATAENERKRDDQSQVRLERHRAKKNAGKRGPAIHRQETAADERRAEEAVLPVGGVDEHGGKGEERHRIERRQIAAQDAIERVAGHRQPAGERPEIGRERQRQGDQERGRRIEERRIAELRTE